MDMQEMLELQSLLVKFSWYKNMDVYQYTNEKVGKKMVRKDLRKIEAVQFLLCDEICERESNEKYSAKMQEPHYKKLGTGEIKTWQEWSEKAATESDPRAFLSDLVLLERCYGEWLTPEEAEKKRDQEEKERQERLAKAKNNDQ